MTFIIVLLQCCALAASALWSILAMGYDFNGNMTYKLKGGQADVYLWDTENRLMQTRRNGAALVESYLYDADGQRKTTTDLDSN